jgi:UDP-N-acetylmuramoyl-tripeptide--D-alanyl-D-alanine ligase
VEFTVREIGAVIGVPVASDARITGWSVDSRSVAAGDLFFALRGPNHDGNAYVDQAISKGAVAAIAGGPGVQKNAGSILVVPDALVALQEIAGWARNQWGGEVVGVTGSAGKTSTKDVIAAMLAIQLPVGKTVGNFNNHVGVPLSILRLPSGARVAVLEMGMNHAGEIRDLCAIARPRIGVVTNVGHAHMEAFDSIDGVAAAKRELIEALPADGVAVLNIDDPLVARFQDSHPGRTITFGLSEKAEFRAVNVEINLEGVKFSVNGVKFESSLLGRHSVSNLLAGIAVASWYGIQPAQLVKVIREMAAPPMRGQIIRHKGILILNDCYNSNPDAARTMIDLLRDTPAKRRIAVLGEMLELGRWAESLHREVGRYVANSGFNVLVGIRGAASSLVDEARKSGQAANAAFFFDDATAAGDYLRQIAQEGDVILFKGSRGTHVEQALERFLAPPS